MATQSCIPAYLLPNWSQSGHVLHSLSVFHPIRTLQKGKGGTSSSVSFPNSCRNVTESRNATAQLRTAVLGKSFIIRNTSSRDGRVGRGSFPCLFSPLAWCPAGQAVGGASECITRGAAPIICPRAEPQQKRSHDRTPPRTSRARLLPRTECADCVCVRRVSLLLPLGQTPFPKPVLCP